MVELRLGPRTIDAPYMLRVYDVTERMFDELVDPDTRAELTDGVMIVHSPTSMLHDRIRRFVGELMNGFASELGLGEVFGPNSLFRPAKGRRYGPDRYFLKTGRIPVPLTKVFRGVPDLAVEVLSPSNRRYDLEEKRPIYQQQGMGEIWLIDPEQHFVLVDRRGDRGKYRSLKVVEGRVESKVLPGFWLDVNWLWSSPLPNALHCLRQILSRS